MIKGHYVRSLVEGVFKKGEKATAQVELKMDLTMPPGSWFKIDAFDPKEEELSYELKGKWIKFPDSVINYIEKYSKKENKDPLEIAINTALYKRIPWSKSYDIFIIRESQKKFLIVSAITAVVGAGIMGGVFYYENKRHEERREQQRKWKEEWRKGAEEAERKDREYREWFNKLSPEEQEKQERREKQFRSQFRGWKFVGDKLEKARSLLGVEFGSTKEQIRKAWLKKAVKYHSDKFEVYKNELMKEFNVKTEAEAQKRANEKFIELGNAKDLLEY